MWEQEERNRRRRCSLDRWMDDDGTCTGVSQSMMRCCPPPSSGPLVFFFFLFSPQRRTHNPSPRDLHPARENPLGTDCLAIFEVPGTSIFPCDFPLLSRIRFPAFLLLHITCAIAFLCGSASVCFFRVRCVQHDRLSPDPLRCFPCTKSI